MSDIVDSIADLRERFEKAVRRCRQAAKEHQNNQFEEGVRETLGWILGEYEDEP